MKKFIKKEISKEKVKELCQKFNISPLESSILARREITKPEDLFYFLEEDLRFTHQSFLFNQMEDAVERILQAKDEEEKILIFGDRDVDGITSTAILFNYLKENNYDVSWKIPTGEEAYGLQEEVIEEFAKNYGSLIITVDCGISNFNEIEKANSLGIDVIVTDHHNPPEKLPNAAVIIDPKVQNSGYPFSEISGAAVAFKLVEALRFSKTPFYNQEFCFLNIVKTENGSKIECLKMKNFVTISEFSEEFNSDLKSFSDTKLYDYIKSELICVWNSESVKKQLKNLFGNKIDFNLYDIEPEIIKFFPSLKNKSIEQLKNISKIAKYTSKNISNVQGLCNLYITFAQKQNELNFPNQKENSNKDLQLVSLAAFADVMPLQNENRIFIKQGLKSMNKNPRNGLKELFAYLDLFGKEITAQTLGWKINPALNAAGRMGESYTAVELLTSENPQERELLAKKIIEFNIQRKENVSSAEFYVTKDAEESISEFDNKLSLVADERIHKGITGLLAGRFSAKFQVPAFVLTLNEEKTIYFGSLRSCRSLNATDLLNKFDENFFIGHGGHDYAAGFSFEKEKLEIFKDKLKYFIKDITLSEKEEEIFVDAELPVQYISEDLLNISQKFEPYGNKNQDLIFYSKEIPIIEANLIGKPQPQHLKLLLDCQNYKFPAIFWNAANKLNIEFSVGEKINILYNIEKNTFNGISKPQINIIDAERSVL